jgi:hypothetical protein
MVNGVCVARTRPGVNCGARFARLIDLDPLKAMFDVAKY